MGLSGVPAPSPGRPLWLSRASRWETRRQLEASLPGPGKGKDYTVGLLPDSGRDPAGPDDQGKKHRPGWFAA